MTQEEKQLLLTDLCARVPYDVKCKIEMWIGCDVCTVFSVDSIGSVEIVEDSDTNGVNIEKIKPYLFPLSSMTEEQKNDCPIDETNLNIIKSNIGYGIIEIPWQLSYLFIDWCNKNHFDYRGLITMGLVNDATGLNIY